MKTIQIELPEDLKVQLEMVDEDLKDFIIRAIREKIQKSDKLVFQKKIKDSAELYAELYNEDKESQEWVNSSMHDWE